MTDDDHDVPDLSLHYVKLAARLEALAETLVRTRGYEIGDVIDLMEAAQYLRDSQSKLES